MLGNPHGKVKIVSRRGSKTWSMVHVGVEYGIPPGGVIKCSGCQEGIRGHDHRAFERDFAAVHCCRLPDRPVETSRNRSDSTLLTMGWDSREYFSIYSSIFCLLYIFRMFSKYFFSGNTFTSFRLYIFLYILSVIALTNPRVYRVLSPSFRREGGTRSLVGQFSCTGSPRRGRPRPRWQVFIAIVHFGEFCLIAHALWTVHCGLCMHLADSLGRR